MSRPAEGPAGEGEHAGGSPSPFPAAYGPVGAAAPDDERPAGRAGWLRRRGRSPDGAGTALPGTTAPERTAAPVEAPPPAPPGRAPAPVAARAAAAPGVTGDAPTAVGPAVTGEAAASVGPAVTGDAPTTAVALPPAPGWGGARPLTPAPAAAPFTTRRPPPPAGRAALREPSRLLLRRFDTWTVFKVSLVFYLLMLVVVLLAGVVAWNVAVALGFIHDIERAVRSLADDRSFVLHPTTVLSYAAAAGAALALAGAVLNVVAAIFYNLISDVVGGVQLVVVSNEE